MAVISSHLLSSEEGTANVTQQAKGLHILVEVFSMLSEEELQMWVPMTEEACLKACMAECAETRMAALKCVAAVSRAVPEVAVTMAEQLCGYQKRMLQNMLSS